MSFRIPASLAHASLTLLGAIVIAAPAGAQTMSVATFLARAAPLRANPLLALTSPDYPVLKWQADTAVRALRADTAARRAAGRPPVACVPDGERIGITDMLAGLDALSARDKGLPLKDGYAKVLASRFPCP